MVKMSNVNIRRCANAGDSRCVAGVSGAARLGKSWIWFSIFWGETRIDSSNDCVMCPTGHSPLTTSQWTLGKGQELNQLMALWNSTGSSCTLFTTYIFTRVNGNLALARAMGDFVFKMNDQLSQVF